MFDNQRRFDRGDQRSAVCYDQKEIYKLGPKNNKLMNSGLTNTFELVLVGGRLDQLSINRRCHVTIAFGH